MGICFPPESLYMYSCRPRRRRSTLRHPEKTGSYSLYENVYRSMPLHRLCFFRYSVYTENVWRLYVFGIDAIPEET